MNNPFNIYFNINQFIEDFLYSIRLLLYLFLLASQHLYNLIIALIICSFAVSLRPLIWSFCMRYFLLHCKFHGLHLCFCETTCNYLITSINLGIYMFCTIVKILQIVLLAILWGHFKIYLFACEYCYQVRSFCHSIGVCFLLISNDYLFSMFINDIFIKCSLYKS